MKDEMEHHITSIPDIGEPVKLWVTRSHPVITLIGRRRSALDFDYQTRTALLGYESPPKYTSGTFLSVDLVIRPWHLALAGACT